MITMDAMIAAGYRKSSVNGTLFKYADWLFQKRFADEIGTKYFINWWHYPARDDMPEAWMVELTQNEPHMTFQIHRPDCITKTEEKCLLFWITLAGSNYYERT